MGVIFINYRRGGHLGLVLAVRERLVAHFGADRVFLDTTSIRAGVRYPVELEAQLDAADVVLAMIHPGWAAHPGLWPPRQEKDWVSIELIRALNRSTPIIPLLLEGAPYLESDALPEKLRPVALKQASRVRAESLSRDVDLVVPALEDHISRSWEPGDEPPLPAARAPRWLPAAAAAVAPVPAVLPGLLWGDRPGVSPAFLATGLSLVVIMAVRAAHVLALRVTHPWVNRLERYLHATGAGAVYVVGPVFAAGLSAFAFIMTAGDREQMYLALILTFFMLLAVGVIMLQSYERDRRLRTTWPYRLPRPVNIAQLRLAVVISREKIENFRRPPGHQDRDRAEWMLRELDGAVHDVRAGTDRRGWVAARRWSMSAGLLVTAATVGLLAGGSEVHPAWRAGLVTAAVALAAGTAEGSYRYDRHRDRTAAGEVEADTADLRRRMGELVAVRR